MAVKRETSLLDRLEPPHHHLVIQQSFHSITSLLLSKLLFHSLAGRLIFRQVLRNDNALAFLKSWGTLGDGLRERYFGNGERGDPRDGGKARPADATRETH